MEDARDPLAEACREATRRAVEAARPILDQHPELDLRVRCAPGAATAESTQQGEDHA